jgi:hypothetical protein
MMVMDEDVCASLKQLARKEAIAVVGPQERQQQRI